MKITNVTPGSKILGFVGNHGMVLPDSGELIVEDKYSAHPSLANMEKDGLVSLSAFNLADQGGDDYKEQFVSVAEYNASMKGLYFIPSTWGSVGTPTSTATPASITGSAVGPFNTTKNFALKLKFDGLDVVRVVFSKAQHDITSLLAIFVADTEFNKYGVAADDGFGKLKITSKALGVNSGVEILADPNDCSKELNLTSPTIVAGTGDPAVVTIPTHGPAGNVLAGISHAITLYDAAVGGAAHTTFQIQRVSKGKAKSGLGTSSAVIISGETGEIVFEAVASGILSTCAADVDIPATHYLATKPTTRLTVSP